MHPDFTEIEGLPHLTEGAQQLAGSGPSQLYKEFKWEWCIDPGIAGPQHRGEFYQKLSLEGKEKAQGYLAQSSKSIVLEQITEEMLSLIILQPGKMVHFFVA